MLLGNVWRRTVTVTLTHVHRSGSAEGALLSLIWCQILWLDSDGGGGEGEAALLTLRTSVTTAAVSSGWASPGWAS